MFPFSESGTKAALTVKAGAKGYLLDGNVRQLQQEFPVPGEEEKKNWLSWFEQNGKEEGKRVVLEH